MQSWLYLFVAIFFEVIGTMILKLNSFTKVIPTIFMFLFYALSFWALTVAIKKIDLGVAYAIWAGLGTAFIAMIGIFYFKEPSNFAKLVSIGLIVIGVIGLHLSNSGVEG